MCLCLERSSHTFSLTHKVSQAHLACLGAFTHAGPAAWASDRNDYGFVLSSHFLSRCFLEGRLLHVSMFFPIMLFCFLVSFGYLFFELRDM